MSNQFGFLRDVNGDKCPRTLLGLIIGCTWLVLCIIGFFYGLSNVIQCQSFIIDILAFMAGVAAVLLGVNAFQKLRKGE